jgi:peptide subunit release factor 1 (eRF1)
MCSGCAGNPEENDILTCLTCGDEYESDSGEISNCPKCKEPVCVECRKKHVDECHARERIACHDHSP